MRQLLLAALASLLVLGSAQAAKESKPRLGTFAGKISGMVLTPRGPGDVKPSDQTVNFKVRGRRLYVTMEGGAWRQSFRVTSDTVREDGARVINYDRDSGHGVLARNEARLEASAPGRDKAYRGMQGSGQVLVQGRYAGWRNVGLGHYQGLTEELKDFDELKGWDESFQGSR